MSGLRCPRMKAFLLTLLYLAVMTAKLCGPGGVRAVMAENLLLILLDLAVTTAKLCGSGGVRAVIAENLLLKQQLIVLRRARRRAPNLTRSDRLLCGFWSMFLSQGRIRKVAIAVRPSTLSRFIRPWSVANTAGCSHRRRVPRSPDRRGRTRQSFGPSLNSSRAIRDSAAHGLR